MTAAVLIIGEDAAGLGACLAQSAPDIPANVAETVRDAVSAYEGQPVVFGNPIAVARALPDMPDVKWVQSTWAGVTPLVEIERRDYVLTGIRGVFGSQMSEYVLGYLLAHELDVFARRDEQRERRWECRASGSLRGKHIGIMGTGSIGQAIAETAAGFGMRVTGLSRTGAGKAPFESVYPAARIGEFLPGLDYLVSVLPHVAATDRLLNADTLALLPPTARFVNVGRGNVVDDAALIAALEAGRLAGAVLDVFDEEPLPESSPLWDARNLLVTAHVAAMSHPGLIVPIFIDNYRRFAAGKSLTNVIDFEHGY